MPLWTPTPALSSTPTKAGPPPNTPSVLSTRRAVRFVEDSPAELRDRPRTPVSLRFLYAHLLTELARHAGHGEFLVEQLRARRGAHEPGD